MPATRRPPRRKPTRQQQQLHWVWQGAFSSAVIVVFVGIGEGTFRALRWIVGDSEAGRWAADAVHWLTWVCCTAWFIWDWVDIFRARWQWDRLK